jgi:hypothetical protein
LDIKNPAESTSDPKGVGDQEQNGKPEVTIMEEVCLAQGRKFSA